MTIVLKSRAELALTGRGFIGNAAAAGFVIPIYSNTTQQFGLWNPRGTPRTAEIISIGLGSYVSTTGAAGGYVLGILKNAPAQLATGAAITAFSETTPDNMDPQVAGGNKIKFGQGATITVTAPTIFRHLSINQDVVPATSVLKYAEKGPVVEFPDRTLWVPPGTAIFLAGNIATLSLYAPTIEWVEHDSPLKEA